MVPVVYTDGQLFLGLPGKLLFYGPYLSSLLRYYLSGPKAGTMDVFVENLPGLPDNISPSASGGYWVGFAIARHTPPVEILTELPILRTLIAKVRDLQLENYNCVIPT